MRRKCYLINRVLAVSSNQVKTKLKEHLVPNPPPSFHSSTPPPKKILQLRKKTKEVSEEKSLFNKKRHATSVRSCLRHQMYKEHEIY